MLKIDKSTHFAILFTFALAFIVIYLYYTINDVRKLQVEIKKVQEDIAAVQKVVTSIGNVKKETVQVAVPATCALKSAPAVNVDIKDVKDETKQTEGGADDAEDASSVNTEEIRDILDVDDGEVEEVVPPAKEAEMPAVKEEVVEESAATVSDAWPSPEQVATMKYDELREFCKKHNLSTKGTRDVLIVRINEAAKL